MGGKFVLAALAFLAPASAADAAAPIYDPVVLNIGINCQWQWSCQRRHIKAMSEARKFIAAEHPPVWRIHLCNRNARRGPANVDWIGFNDCIRNPHLSPPRSRPRRR